MYMYIGQVINRYIHDGFWHSGFNCHAYALLDIGVEDIHTYGLMNLGITRVPQNTLPFARCTVRLRNREHLAFFYPVNRMLPFEFLSLNESPGVVSPNY